MHGSAAWDHGGRLLFGSAAQVQRRWGAAPEPGTEIDYTKAIAGLPVNAVRELDDAIRETRITSRTAARCLRLVWTRADLDGRAQSDIAHIWLTLSHRSGMLGLLRDPRLRGELHQAMSCGQGPDGDKPVQWTKQNS